MDLSTPQQCELLALARASIAWTLEHGTTKPCPPEPFEPALMTQRSCFVTLRIASALRGCCGSIEATRPLAHDVWRNAWASAFNDPRFAPLAAVEGPQLQLHISVLTPPLPLVCASEPELLDQLRAHEDGLILELGAARATFLPAVWEQLADPAQFVRQLKVKAGWRADFWSSQIRVWRYAAQSFGEEPEK